MSKGKYLKKPDAKKSNSQLRFIMPKSMKDKIIILLAGGLLFSTLNTAIANTAEASSPENESTTNKIECTIGIPNNNTTITVDGKTFEVDQNSFIISSNTDSFAYDESGNILKGIINNFKKVLKIPEEELDYYTLYQVVSESGANVRSSGEIKDGNIISTVPSLDYVLGHTTRNPEYDGEWVPTISINGNELYEGFISKNLLREVASFKSIRNRDDSLLQDTEKSLKVNTSQDGNIGLNLRTSPDTSGKGNIIAEIPNGSTVTVIGETIKSGNRNWSRVIYQSNDGNKFEGWVASDYLTSNIIQEIQETQPAEKTEKLMQVNTSQDGNIGLNLRSSPETFSKQNIITEIPNGSIVTVIGENTKSGNRTWCQVIYKSNDGNNFEGWVAADYLTSNIVQQPPQQTEEIQETHPAQRTQEIPQTEPQQMQTNQSGTVTGIDISAISSEDLRDLFQNGIPNSVKAANIRKC